ncbi:uncharacterized protein CTRU02_215490 [Colletotrichum truncatum]|uniref:Uncharacterized protein n=1 Tax=Colletotrichum truncatum TaxID=5467 RepID=A0ACC3YCK8_COLTU|nr:uncharacterized protein CTRU02_05566 [Colletotrichum truncatum]KAF6794009.1 hypothetical protein CTRU02_05566 [Colletotrichum truncatum]
MSWPIFSTRQLEETLYPLARALAWSYCIDGNEEAAVEFLRAIWNESQPFTGRSFKITNASPRPPLRSPSYAFVGSLLQGLMDKAEKTSIQEQLEEMKSRQELQFWVGVQFNKEGALVVRKTVGSIRVYYPPRILLSQSGVKLLRAMPGGKARAKEPRRRHKQRGGTRATFVYRLRSLQP